MADLEVLCRTSTVLYTSRGRKPGARPGGVSRSRTEPLAPRAKGPAAPSTLARRASTFGNTGKRRIPHKSSSSTNVAHSKKALTLSISAFSVNQQLPILPGRFQPSTFGVCELNYRVRHGYGCILTAIATESLRVCSLKTA